MTRAEFDASLTLDQPPSDLSPPLAALWWDAKGDWQRGHALIDELETVEAMAVHAYLHRKEGATSNAQYWYDRAGRTTGRVPPQAEWQSLVNEFLR